MEVADFFLSFDLPFCSPLQYLGLLPGMLLKSLHSESIVPAKHRAPNLGETPKWLESDHSTFL